MWPLPTTTTLCGETWLDILTPPKPFEPHLQAMAQQYIAARLNVAMGASTTPDIDWAINEAEVFMDDCLINDTTAGSNITDRLDDYNNGRTGPGHCDSTSDNVDDDHDHRND